MYRKCHESSINCVHVLHIREALRSCGSITCAAVNCVVISITVIGIATASTSKIIFAAAIASRLAVAASTAVVASTATAIASGRLPSSQCVGCCFLRDARPDDPFIGNKPNAEPGSSYAFPSSSCGCQSRVCYGTP